MGKYMHLFKTDEEIETYYENYYEEPFVGYGGQGYVGYNLIGANGYEYVDLGLPSRVIWATCNIGASSPEESGVYFAWGETYSKSQYGWSTYSYGSSNNIQKYNNSDGLERLEKKDDAAWFILGRRWRIPTRTMVQELIDNTTSTWEALNGVYGRRFTASNGNSIFIPAAGKYSGSSLTDDGDLCGIWTSTVGGIKSQAYSLYGISDSLEVDASNRSTGYPIRGVIGSELIAVQGPIEQEIK